MAACRLGNFPIDFADRVAGSSQVPLLLGLAMHHGFWTVKNTAVHVLCAAKLVT